ncbi:GAF domain-containing protein [Hymenobacter bucti]|uniref:GAF domain-containing protein n=1 Tax=Hymenobacter bucti TaxID=1844114 RepID=A0ABW4QYQ7_9BACT
METPADATFERPNLLQYPSPTSDYSADGLLDALPWGVLVLDEQRIVRRANQQMARWCGAPPAALLGRPLAEADLPPALGVALLEMLREPATPATREIWLPEHHQWVALSATRHRDGWVVYGQPCPAPAGRRPEDETPTQPQPYAPLVAELRNGDLAMLPDIARGGPAPGAAQRLHDELALGATDKYRALFYAMEQGFCVLEILFDATGQQAVDFRYLELNPLFAQQSGMPADARGKTVREVLPGLESFWFDTYGRVARTGEPVRVEHYVPQVSRWFDVHAFRVGAPAAHQVAVLFNDITARKNAETTLRLAAAADTFRLQLADALGPLTDPVAIQEAVTHLARRHFGADRCCYCEIEAGRAIVRCDAASPGLPSAVGNYPLSDLILLHAAIDTGRPVSVADVHQADIVDADLLLRCVQQQVIAYLAIPVFKNGQLVGGLCLVQSVPREWLTTEVVLAVEVAERTWMAVAQNQAQQALRLSEQRQDFLLQLSDALRPLTDAVDIQATVAQKLGQHLGVDWAYYVDLHEAAQEFVVARDWHRPDAPSHARRYPFSTWAMPLLVEGRTWVCCDADTDPHLPEAQRSSASRAAVVVPLLKQKRLVAMLVAAQRTLRRWTAQEVSLVEEVAERTWVAVERAKAEEALRVQQAHYRADLEGQVQERTAELKQSRDFLQATMDSTVDMIQVFEAVRDDAGQIVDFRWLLNNHSSESRYGEVRGQSLLERNPGVVKEGIFAAFKQVVETGEPQQAERRYAHEQFDGWFFQSIVKLGDGVATSTKDITAWKKDQAEILRLRLSRQQALFEAVQAAQEAERRRIAEGLHNGIGQLLYATKLRLDQLHPRPDDAPPAWQAAHRDANQLLSEAIHQTRVLSHELVPLVLEEFGLAEALQDICDKLSSPQLRLHCQVQLDAEATPLSSALQLAIYRMAQELAQNIVKHALGATEASLELETTPGWALLRVEDNGPGFATLPPAEAGLGLRSIRDQVALLGGQLETGAVPAGGAYVRIRIPDPASDTL